MSATVPMSVRLSKETKDRLSQLSKATDRSQAALAAEAIDQFIDLNEWQVAVTKMAVEAADAGGPFVAHEEIMEWLKSWGGGDEKPAPEAKLRRG